jgi:uncharacterized protein (DUF433 family)
VSEDSKPRFSVSDDEMQRDQGKAEAKYRLRRSLIQPPVVRTPGVMGGEACFAGTRVPVDELFACFSPCVYRFLLDYPSVDHAAAKWAIEEACRLLKSAVPTVPYRPKGRHHRTR